MTNELTKPEDDGFSGSLSNSKRRGTFVNWADATGWRDRDGLEPPSPVLVVAIDEALQRWANKVPTLITDKPLPDPASLNEQIPAREWEIGLDGQPVPPWKHVVIVLLVNIATGGIYKYVAPTAGAHIAVDLLKELGDHHASSTRVARSAGGEPHQGADEDEVWTEDAAAFRDRRLEDAGRGRQCYSG